MNTQEKGKIYETLSCTYLLEKGYTILSRNYQKKCGEIDIIAQKNDLISFIEVKYRENSKYYTPKEAVTLSKQKKIIKTANFFIYENFEKSNCNFNYTFDIIEIINNGNTINHIENAFYL
ncbi:MAG: YraN family protein [Lachnospirales bacterium]